MSAKNLDNHNLMVALSNINLKDFTPYCEHFTAYPLTGGNLTFRSQNIIADRFLKRHEPPRHISMRGRQETQGPGA